MKEIDVLLEKYAQGELTQEEQQALNQLTHRDEVLAAAGARAHQLRRKQRTRVTALASLLVLAAAGITFYLHPAQAVQEGEPIVAQTDVRPSVQVQPQTPAPAAVAAEPQQVRKSHAAQSVVRESVQAVAAPVEKAAAEPLPAATQAPVHLETEAIVACNTQCSPDSVISDIWKFLKA